MIAQQEPCKPCDKPKSLPVIAKPDYAALRQGICNSCEFSAGDVCSKVDEKYPGKSSIKSGVQRKGLRCPLPDPKWTEEPMECPACHRIGKVIPEAQKVCDRCVMRASITGKTLAGRFTVHNSIKKVEPYPFIGDTICNLHYFLYPRYETSTRYHLAKLKESISQFNGKRVCCVAVDGDTIEKTIVDELNSIFTDVYFCQNDPKKREGVGFIASLEKMQTKDPNQVICFAHAKGQQHHTQESGTIRKWSDAMYETVVANWSGAKDAMEKGYPVAGSFRSAGTFKTTSHKWHYSGSFWWARSERLFGNIDWRRTCRHWWMSESYVGRHWEQYQGYCLFGDNIGHGALYKDSTWTDSIDNELIEWRQRNVVNA